MKPKQTTVTLFGFSFLSSATYAVARALGLSLFIARIGSSSLPVALVASAIVVILVSLVTHWIVSRFPVRHCVSTTWLSLASISILMASLLDAYDHSFLVLAFLYVLAEVRGSLNTVYVTTCTNDSFASSPTKRPYVLVAAGAPIAGILAGGLMSYGAADLNVTTWLNLIAVLDVATLITVRWLPKHLDYKRSRKSKGLLRLARTKVIVRKRSQAIHRRPIGEAAFRYRYGLAGLIGLKVAVLTLVEYQWKVVAGDFYLKESELIAYFAGFYAISDVLIVLLQLSAATKLLDRYGIGLPLRAYPVLLATLGIVAMSFDLPIVLMVAFTIASGLNVLRRSLHDPGLASAYSILDPSIRRETIVLVKGMIKPFAEAIAAIGLLFFANALAPNLWTLIWIGLLVPWFLVAHWVAAKYDRVGKPRQPATSDHFDAA